MINTALVRQEFNNRIDIPRELIISARQLMERPIYQLEQKILDYLRVIMHLEISIT